jgi:hypothetical protein
MNYDLELALQKSYKNCHAKGLHSIVLNQSPNGELTRFYYTTSDHCLEQNLIPEVKTSLAIHSHRFDLKFTTLRGEMINVTYRFPTENEFVESDIFTAWKFQSQILTGRGSFLKQEHPQKLLFVDAHAICEKKSIKMKATELHTVGVFQGHKAAWLVEETNFNPHHNDICYTNNDMENFNFDGLYQKYSSKEEIEKMIKEFF